MTNIQMQINPIRTGVIKVRLRTFRHLEPPKLAVTFGYVFSTYLTFVRKLGKFDQLCSSPPPPPPSPNTISNLKEIHTNLYRKNVAKPPLYAG